MLVSHYAEFKDKIVGGIAEAVKNQRKALERKEIDYTTQPDLSADIIHLSFIGPKSIYYSLRASFKPVKLILNVHTTGEDVEKSYKFSSLLSRPFKLYLKFFYSQADLLITPSNYTEELIKREYGLEDEKVKKISNGVDISKLEEYQSLRKESRKKHQVSGKVVFCVGTAFERKGLSDFIETARRLPEIDFIWFGKIYDEKIVSKNTRRSLENAPDNVTFTGYVDDIREAYAAGDIFFYPTFVENQGIPAFESAYCGKPIVMRDIRAFKEDFEDGENCIKGETPEEFAEGIREIIDDDSFRKKLVENVRSVYERHSLDTVGDELLETYKELLDEDEENE